MKPRRNKVSLFPVCGPTSLLSTALSHVDAEGAAPSPRPVGWVVLGHAWLGIIPSHPSSTRLPMPPSFRAPCEGAAGVGALRDPERLGLWGSVWREPVSASQLQAFEPLGTWLNCLVAERQRQQDQASTSCSSLGRQVEA